MRAQTRETRASLTPRKALALLEEGNARFQANLNENRDLLEQVNVTASGQFPFAVVLSCIDSRTSAELIFDQGLGDIFSIRIAGNVLNEDILGSMEFACKVAGSKLIVVLGHDDCGAVRGACAGVSLGHLTGLLQKIRPSVEEAESMGALELDVKMQRVAELNVGRSVAGIRAQSPVLEALIETGTVGIVGAMYSVRTGEVRFRELVIGSH